MTSTLQSSGLLTLSPLQFKIPERIIFTSAIPKYVKVAFVVCIFPRD